MEVFELILVILACVIVSALADQMLKHVSLPLVQILIGFVAALFLPEVAEVNVDPELFLVLFIAPLLFNDARESSKAALRSNLASILSMAIGLVVLTVVVVGFALNAMVPAIPLAAAFACAAALGPTDAAAVGALGATINLSERQKALLSGEALINDASGVVSFQFAIAAAMTGAFSLADAGASFAVLFFGGIVVGLAMGAFAFLSIYVLRSRGFENTVVHVLYEVFTPFVVFLASEALGVSGILAVVAAGLVMANTTKRLASVRDAREQVLSNGFWEIIIFVINGTLFVLLGMQLPQAMSPTLAETLELPQLVGIIVVMTALVIGVRFVWVSFLELVRVDPETGRRGIAQVGATLKNALVTTIAGPKGAVTLSIIFTIPLALATGEAFPNRNLIIFLTAGVILLTLIVADAALPLLAGKEVDEGEERAMRVASIAVLRSTLDELRQVLKGNPDADYVPALRLAIARYRSRLFRESLELEGAGDELGQLLEEVFECQQKRADEIQGRSQNAVSVRDAAPYYAILRGIRSSVGYAGAGAKVGSQFDSLGGRLALAWQRLFPKRMQSEHAERVYYDTCLFAIELERAAVDYLEGVVAQGGPRAEIAQVLANEHQSSLESLWGRINYGQDTKLDPDMELEHGIHTTMPEGMTQTFGEQFRKARQYADEVDATALNLELNAIRRLRYQGEITESQARELREGVYLMQMSLGE